MNFKQLDAFLAFMAAGSTIAAAAQLGSSQSAVSRLLSQLEADLGINLFMRRKGRLLPTNEAEALLSDVQNMVSGNQAFYRHVNQLRLGGARRTLIRMQLPTTVSHLVMPQVAAAFMRDYPEVVIEIFSGSYDHGEVAVLAREADLTLVRLPTQTRGLTATPLLVTEAVCVMPAGHPLAALEVITPMDLKGKDMVLLGRQRPLRHDIDMAFRKAGVIPQVRAEVHSVEMACRLAAQGLGVSIVNGLLASLCRDMAIERRPFRPRIDYRFGIATLETQKSSPLLPELIRRFVAAVIELAEPGSYEVISSKQLDAHVQGLQ